MKCTKRKFKRKRDVKTALSQARQNGRDELRYYWCRTCRAYHLTQHKNRLRAEAENGRRKLLTSGFDRAMVEYAKIDNYT